MTSLKRQFIKHYSKDFSKHLMKDAKLILGKALKVLRQYLPSFIEILIKSQDQGIPPAPLKRGAG